MSESEEAETETYKVRRACALLTISKLLWYPTSIDKNHTSRREDEQRSLSEWIGSSTPCLCGKE
jgi:hypothetical protein